MKNYPVTFSNNRGSTLHGILSEPEGHRKEHAVVLLSPGIKNRVAPHRLYVKMADDFCKKGYLVFRFDPEGLGDSEGHIEEELLADLYGSIQVGRFIDDTRCSMDFLAGEYGFTEFILSGLCGGAITGLLTAAHDERVKGLLSLGIPVILDSSSIDKSRYMTRGQLQDLKKGYLRRMLSPKSWFRLMTFQSDYSTISRSLFTGLGSGAEKQTSDTGVGCAEEGAMESIDGSDSNMNPYFHATFLQTATRKMNHLMIFSESDRLYWEFKEKYLDRHYRELKPVEDHFSVKIINEANHIFSFKKWQEDMLLIASSWLVENYN